MTPPGCCSGARVLDVKKSVISSNSLMWIQERIWQYLLQISLRGKPVRLFFFQMQIGLLTVAVRFLGEEFKRKGNTPLGRIWGVWVILIKWEEGTKDTWRMTPGSRMLHQNWPGQNLMGGGNFYFCRFLSWTTSISAAPSLLPWLRYSVLITVQNLKVPFLDVQVTSLVSTAGVPITVSSSYGPLTGSYSLRKYLSSPREILSTTQDAWGMSRREWFQGVQCVVFFYF